MTDESQAKQPINKRAMVAGCILLAGAGFYLMRGGPSTPTSGPTQQLKPVEVGNQSPNEISVTDRDAALTQFAKQFEAVQQRISLSEAEQQKRDEQAFKKIEEVNNRLQSNIAALTDEIVQLRANQADETYSRVNGSDPGNVQPPSFEDVPDLQLEGLNFNMSPPQPSQDFQPARPSPYGPNYFILKPDNVAPAVSTQSGGNDLGASSPQQFGGMTTPSTSASNLQYRSAREEYEAQRTQATAAQQGQQAQTTRIQKVVIPAFSFVEVTTLHGVACPVGASSPGSQTEIPARPVVLPVRGIFRGPNGSSVDVGNIHLMGLCSGRRTSSSNTGRATVRVEQMSYWDSSGGAQMEPSTGYIVDTRDNEQDVYGRLEKVSGRTLALQSAAAAAAAASAAVAQGEYTTQNSLDSNGSTSTSQLTGNAGKAAVSQGVATLFTQIGDRFEREANAAFDTVIVEPGIKLRFVTDQPIYIYQPAEAFDLDGGMRDVLL
jgi:hypothetical protein